MSDINKRGIKQALENSPPPTKKAEDRRQKIYFIGTKSVASRRNLGATFLTEGLVNFLDICKILLICIV